MSRQKPLSPCTEVELLWVEKRIERWLRFGHVAHEQVLDRRRRVLSLRAGTSFAFVRWASNAHGTVQSRLDILRAPRPGEAFQTVPHVSPGAVILLRVHSWAKVERALELIDAIEVLGITPEAVPASYWRHAHNRFATGQQPRVYSYLQHRAALQRQELLA